MSKAKKEVEVTEEDSTVLVAKGEEVMSYSKISLLFDHPYLSPAVWGCRIVPMNDIPNTDFAAIDQHWRLYYIPKNWGKLSIAEGTTILYHELMHALRNHFDRALLQIPKLGGVEDQTKVSADDQKSFMAWAMATDCEINDDLMSEKMTFPTILNPKTKEYEPYAVYPKQFSLPDGELAEFYFKTLKKKIKTVSIPIVGFGNKGSCGSGADGQTKSYEKGDGTDKDKDSQGNQIPKGLSNSEKEILRRMVAEEIKARGDTPEHWNRWAEGTLNPKVNWMAAFMTCLRNNVNMVLGKTDYTWRKLSRRQDDNNPFLYPALQGPQPKVVVIVDSSGSMDTETDLPMCLSEVQGILRATGCDVTVMSVDAAVHTKQQIRSVKSVKIKGGGGTDMAVGIEAAQLLKPDFIVVLSDGITPWPRKSPKYNTKLLIGLTTKPHRSWPLPPYAKVFNLWDK